MGKLLINGGIVPHGSVRVGGNKNAALPMLAAALLTKDKVTIHNMPDILDVRTMMEIIRALGGNAYAAKKTVAAAKKYRTDRLRRAVIAFADVDAKLKQGILREDDSLLIAVYRAFSEAAAHE